MYYVENIVRRVAHAIGWEIGSAIENVVWGVIIAVLLCCCSVFACLAVGWKIIFR